MTSIKSEDIHWKSPNLSAEMTLRVYGERGRPLLVFPQQEGHYFDFEGFGMVEACRSYLEQGKFRLYCVDSVDKESWANWAAAPTDRARRHDQYDAYIAQEVVPFITRTSKCAEREILTLGCSLGGYHAATSFFRHPEVFGGFISLSGIFDLRLFIGAYMDQNVYFHAPLHFLKNLDDQGILQFYRTSTIIVCVGQGAWEDEMLVETRQLESILKEKQVPAWIDYWGPDVDHDWPWWRKQLPYFLAHVSAETMTR